MKNPVILIIGLGGTGSFFLEELWRSIVHSTLFNSNKDSHLRYFYPKLILVDGDIVENNNLKRQNFYRQEVSLPKVFALHNRFTSLHGSLTTKLYINYLSDRLWVNLLTKELSSSKLPDPLIIVSCVDNVRTRARLYSYLRLADFSSMTFSNASNLKIKNDRGHVCKPNWIFLDAGNSESEGWVSCLVWAKNQFWGCDMRMREAQFRNPTDTIPNMASRGCANSNNPQTRDANFKNAMILMSQLTSLMHDNRAFGLCGWSSPNMKQENWFQQSYLWEGIEPFEVKI